MKTITKADSGELVREFLEAVKQQSTFKGDLYTDYQFGYLTGFLHQVAEIEEVQEELKRHIRYCKLNQK